MLGFLLVIVLIKCYLRQGKWTFPQLLSVSLIKWLKECCTNGKIHLKFKMVQKKQVEITVRQFAMGLLNFCKSCKQRHRLSSFPDYIFKDICIENNQRECIFLEQRSGMLPVEYYKDSVLSRARTKILTAYYKIIGFSKLRIFLLLCIPLNISASSRFCLITLQKYRGLRYWILLML